MDAINAVLTRRSVRSYNEKNISDQVIKELLNAAFCAPSAGNQQPWQFIVINDKDTLNKIPGLLHPSSVMLKKANKALLVCGDLSFEKHKGYWMVDCAAATQNILITARALDLGACWLGIYPREERMNNLSQLFKTPDHIIPFALISLGYTDEEQNKEDRYDNDRVHHNNW